jgi:hypothetical protein
MSNNWNWLVVVPGSLWLFLGIGLLSAHQAEAEIKADA